MNLDRVTITGADDGTPPEKLAELSKEFSFVEWGILASASSMGSPRFPSMDWMLTYRGIARRENLKASLHICGRWLRQLMLGEPAQELWTIIDHCQRAQLNFHGQNIPMKLDRFVNALVDLSSDGQREFIFQIDGNLGAQFICDVAAEDKCLECLPLFDCSHGAGILPGEWPTPFDPDYAHGYAGGLGPDNLAEQLPLIGKAAGDCRIWIDMETKVRSEDDRQFDLAKVRRCLEICAPFVAK